VKATSRATISKTGCRSNALLAHRGEQLARRGLPLERLLGLLEQAGVRESNDRLVGERLDKLDLPFRERPRLAATKNDRAERDPFPKQWSAQHSPLSVLAQRDLFAARELVGGPDIGYVHDRPIQDRATGDGPSIDRDGAGHVDRSNVTR